MHLRTDVSGSRLRIMCRALSVAFVLLAVRAAGEPHGSTVASDGSAGKCDTDHHAAGDQLTCEVPATVDGERPSRPPQVQAVQFHQLFYANSSLQYNHMAMVERIPATGRIVVAWQAARASEGSKSQVLLTSFSSDSGTSWSNPQRLPRVPDDPPGVLWSPVLHWMAEKEEMLLFYSESIACLRPPKEKNGVVTSEPRWNPGGDIKVVSSFDGGETWTDPRMVYSQAAEGGIPKVIANRLHVLEQPGGRARLLLPFWRERARGAAVTELCPQLTGGGHETSGVLISDDAGDSWRPAGRIADPAGATWLIEGTLAAAGGGSLLMLLRSSTDAVWASRSEDGGETWTTARPIPLPNPNSKLSLVGLQSWNGLLMASLNHHPRLRGDHSRTRSQLSLVVSGDGGHSWQMAARLEDAMTPGNWYHYPTILEVSRGRVLVAYSAQHTADKTDGIRLASVALRAATDDDHDDGHPPLNARDPLAGQISGTSAARPLSGALLSASSTHPDCRASWATLHGPRAWCAGSLDSFQWLQLDLRQVTNITHLVTAGRPDSRSDQRVTAFTVSSSMDGWRWERYRGPLQEWPGVEEVVLSGNGARGELQTHRLVRDSGGVSSLGIMAKAVRIHPVRWVGHMAMQAGLFSGEPPAESLAGKQKHDEL